MLSLLTRSGTPVETKTGLDYITTQTQLTRGVGATRLTFFSRGKDNTQFRHTCLLYVALLYVGIGTARVQACEVDRLEAKSLCATDRSWMTFLHRCLWQQNVAQKDFVKDFVAINIGVSLSN